MNLISAKEAAERWGISERMVRKYCAQKRIPTAVLKNGVWHVAESAAKPERKVIQKELPKGNPKRVAYQRKKNNHYWIYEYIQVNLAYSSSRMASNRPTREQVIEIFRTGKVSLAFEPMKIDDLVEISNHFFAGKYMVDTIMEPVTESYIRRLHQKMFSGTQAVHKGILHIGEYRKTPDKFGVEAAVIHTALKTLMTEYENKKNITLYDVLDFHARFEQSRG